tara:strand:- start:497 stop:646 length:150 start_codon:yes stop_codon:yes gene_type:complete
MKNLHQERYKKIYEQLTAFIWLSEKENKITRKFIYLCRQLKKHMDYKKV